MAKYTGVTQNPDGSWTYRIKIKLPDGSVKDTRIKKDARGNPFLTARQAFDAKKEHETRIRTNPEENIPKTSPPTPCFPLFIRFLISITLLPFQS